MPTLARKLLLPDYFALAFGTMVGVGWLVLMDDWLGRSGPLGAALGFALGGVILLPVGYVYGQWVQRLPDAAGVTGCTPGGLFPMGLKFTRRGIILGVFIMGLCGAQGNSIISGDVLYMQRNPLKSPHIPIIY